MGRRSALRRAGGRGRRHFCAGRSWLGECSYRGVRLELVGGGIFPVVPQFLLQGLPKIIDGGFVFVFR